MTHFVCGDSAMLHRFASMRRFLFLLLLVASSASAQSAGSAMAALDAVQKLIPSDGSFGFVREVDVAIEGDTAIVKSALNNSIYVFQLDTAGTWQQAAVIAPSGILTGKIAIAGGRVFVQFQDQQDFLRHLVSYVQNDSGRWIEERSIIVSAHAIQYFVDKSGSQLLTVTASEDSYSPELVRISELNENNAWETKIESSEDGLVDDLSCIAQERAAANGALFLKDENGEWVKSSVDVDPRTPSALSFRFISSDCEYVLDQPFSGNYSEGSVYRLDDSEGWVFEWSFTGWNSLNFIANDRFALFGVAGYAANGKKDTVRVYEKLDAGQWVALGELKLDEYKGGFGRSIALDGNTALVSSLVPLEVTAFDLSRYEFADITRVCASGYPTIDPDNDGYGWDNNETCLIPQAELSPDDSNRDQTITIDTAYSGPTPLANSIGSYNDYDNGSREYDNYAVPQVVVKDHNTVATLVETDADRFLINVYQLSDHSDWQLEQVIDVSDLLDRSYPADTFLYSPPRLASFRIDIDQNVLALGYADYFISNALFIFERDESGDWRLVREFQQPISARAGYATSVDVSGDTIAVRSGDIGGEFGNSAKVHVYTKNSQSDWVADSEINDPRGLTPAPSFAYSLALDDNTLIVGNRHLYSRLYHFADVFVRDDTGEWLYQQSLYPGDGSGQGLKVDLKGDTALLELNGKLHMYKRDATGQWNPSVVMTGGDLVIRHGGLWKRDQSTLPSELEVGVKLYPVEFSYNESNTSAPGNVEPLDTTCVETGLIGDGWGWSGTDSCRLDVIAELPPVEPAPSNAACIDTGLIGDGWGWNGTESCQPEIMIDSCIYDFADLNAGWGWNPATMESCPPRL